MKKIVKVNDKMQKGYKYELTEPDWIYKEDLRGWFQEIIRLHL